MQTFSIFTYIYFGGGKKSAFVLFKTLKLIGATAKS